MHRYDYYDFQSIPLIDIEALRKGDPQGSVEVAKQIREACKSSGFFYIKNHGISQELYNKIIQKSREFFALPVEYKMKIPMKEGGRAWRGYFMTGEELTSGKKDLKEGLYLGEYLDDTHELVKAGAPLHGHNLFPQKPEELKPTILEWMRVVKELGTILLQGVSLSLGLKKYHLTEAICKDPLCLFRIFNYPAPDGAVEDDLWGVGYHTDYGLLTILMITDKGLEVKNRKNYWVKADPIPGTFVINIGDMLYRLTKGLYRSTPHRVKNNTGKDRLSFPFFYDPGWKQQIYYLEFSASEDYECLLKQTQVYERWDKMNLTTVSGNYGQYLMKKLAKVFPDLSLQNLKPHM